MAAIMSTNLVSQSLGSENHNKEDLARIRVDWRAPEDADLIFAGELI